MKTAPNPLVVARNAMTEAQRAFAAAVENADRILDARLTEANQLVQTSAGEIASLQSALELYDGLEQTRLAAATRRDMATADDHHRATVDRAKVLQHQAWADYHKSVLSAAAALSATQLEPAPRPSVRETR